MAAQEQLNKKFIELAQEKEVGHGLGLSLRPAACRWLKAAESGLPRAVPANRRGR